LIEMGGIGSNTAVSRDERLWPALSVTLLLFVLLFFLSLNIGKVHVTFADIIAMFLDKMNINQEVAANIAAQKQIVFWNVRLPRSILACSVGAALSVAGAVMQTLYRNPLASPDVIGVTQAANLGVGISIFFFSASTMVIQGFSFSFGVLALLLSFAIVSRLPGSSVTVLVLIGVIISALFQAGLTLLLYLSDPYSDMLRINYWLLGAFNASNWEKVGLVFPLVLVGIFFLIIFSWRLNIMGQTDEEIKSLGINLPRWRFIYVMFVALIVSVSTAAVGNISWVGLIIPHIARSIIGSNQKQVVPYAAVLGALFLLLIDTIIRNLPAGEVPISVITSFVAAPYLGWLIFSKQKRGVW
jgi:iron complex transport system permease protein